MPAKRKHNPVAAPGRTNKRHRESASYRGRRIAHDGCQPHQTRSRAATPGASPLANPADNTEATSDNQGKLILDSIERDEFVSADQAVPALLSLGSPLAGTTAEFLAFEREGAPSPELLPETKLQTQPLPTIILPPPNLNYLPDQFCHIDRNEERRVNTDNFRMPDWWYDSDLSYPDPDDEERLPFSELPHFSFTYGPDHDWSMFGRDFSFEPKAEPKSPVSRVDPLQANEAGACNMCAQVCGRLDHCLLGFYTPPDILSPRSRAQGGLPWSDQVSSRKRKLSTGGDVGDTASGADTAPAHKRLKRDLLEDLDSPEWHIPHSSDSDSSDSIELDVYLDLKMKASGDDNPMSPDGSQCSRQHANKRTSLSQRQSEPHSNSTRTSLSALFTEGEGEPFSHDTEEGSLPTTPLADFPFFGDYYTGRNSPSYMDSNLDCSEEGDGHDGTRAPSSSRSQSQGNEGEEYAVIDGVIEALRAATEAEEDGYDGDLEEQA